MVKLEKSNYAEIYQLYLKDKFFFPLIAAVLLDEQDGVVYADSATSPAQVYVEHAFGFSQIFGEYIKSFEGELERYLLADRAFTPSKIRLYAPAHPKFLASSEHHSLRSYRQRFTINADDPVYRKAAHSTLEKDLSLHEVDANNISHIDKKFNVVNRFWRTPTDFIQRSNAVIVFYQGAPASICYSAAEANQCAEIDVLTLPEYRSKGLAKLAVTHFVNRCFNLSLQPLWDCFTNNIGSMMLCKSVGFTALNSPYPFFTIDK